MQIQDTKTTNFTTLQRHLPVKNGSLEFIRETKEEIERQWS
jgi:hypothetical protein